jgi:glycosyltransferase involved in cell wall biosynthesis
MTPTSPTPAAAVPLVSVVIPTYNAPALLLETLATVLAQTFADFEVVVIDDGSTDDTLARLAAVGDPRLRVLTQPNQGIGRARNRGLREARGRYVAFLDHDDLWDPQKLAVQVDFMERHPQCVACGVPWRLSDGDSTIPADFPSCRDAEQILTDPLRSQARTGWTLTTSALMVRRDAVAGIEFGEQRNTIEDVPFYIGVMLRGPVGLPGDRPLMIYRVHEGNFSRRADYFYNGMRALRQLDRAGQFPTSAPAQRQALDQYLGQVGYGALMFQLLGGYRRRGAALWLRELRHLLRAGRYKMLLAYPPLLLLPRALLRRRWKKSVI